MFTYSYAGEGIPELKDYFREYVLCSLGQKMKNTNQAFRLDFVCFLKLAGRIFQTRETTMNRKKKKIMFL